MRCVNLDLLKIWFVRPSRNLLDLGVSYGILVRFGSGDGCAAQYAVNINATDSCDNVFKKICHV